MRRLLLLGLLLVCFAVPAAAQTTSVSAVIKDSQGNIYANCSFSVNFVDPGTSGKLPLLNGSTFQTVFSGTCDSSGNFSVVLADNSVIGSSSGATGTQWKFSFCAKGTPVGMTSTPCFTYTGTISGSSMELSARLTPLAPILSTLTSFDSTFLAGNLSGSVTSPTSAPTFAVESTTGGSIAAGTYYCVVTYGNLNGETTKSPEASVTTTGATSKLRIRPGDNNWMTGGYRFRAYCGTTTGGPYFLQTPAAFAINTNWHYSSHATAGGGDTILTSVAGTGSNPPATNTATIDPLQVAVNSGSDYAAFSPPYSKATVLLAAGTNYILTTPLVLGSNPPKIRGHSIEGDISLGGTASQQGSLIYNTTFNDSGVGSVMVMGRGASLENISILSFGTLSNGLMVVSGDGNTNGLNLRGVILGSNNDAAVAPLRVYHSQNSFQWNFENVTTNGTGRAGAWISNSSVAQWKWKQGRINCSSVASSSAILHDGGPGDLDRNANFVGIITALVLTLEDVDAENCKGPSIDVKGSKIVLRNFQNADALTQAGAVASAVSITDDTGSFSLFGSQAGLQVYNSRLFGSTNATATVNYNTANSSTNSVVLIGNALESSAAGVTLAFNNQKPQTVTIVGNNGVNMNPAATAGKVTGLLINAANASRYSIFGNYNASSASADQVNAFTGRLRLWEAFDSTKQKTLNVNVNALEFLAADETTVLFSLSNTGVTADTKGFKHARVASCTTAAAAGSTCDTTWTFTTAFADTSYTAACTIDGPTGVPYVLHTKSKAAASVVVTIANLTAVAASGTLNCEAVHD